MGQCAVVVPPHHRNGTESGNIEPQDVAFSADKAFLKKHRSDQYQIVDNHQVNPLLDEQTHGICRTHKQATEKLFPTKSNADINAIQLRPPPDWISVNEECSFVPANNSDDSFVALETTEFGWDLPRPGSYGRDKEKRMFSAKANINKGQKGHQLKEEIDQIQAESSVLACPGPVQSKNAGFKQGLLKPKMSPHALPFLKILLPANFFEFFSTHFIGVTPIQTDYHHSGRQQGMMRHGAPFDRSQSESSRSSGVEFAILPPSTQVTLPDGSPFLDLAVSGSLGLVDRNKRCKELIRIQRYPCLDHYIVLMSKTCGVPIAVCALKSQLGLPVVRIYSTKRRVTGQHRAALTSKLGFTWTNSFPLYCWAEIVTKSVYPMPFSFSIFMSSGPDGSFEKTPSYRATSNIFTNCPNIRVLGRTESEESFSGCCILRATQEHQYNPSLELSLSRGIDPGLFICFASVVDEIMDHALRKFCSEN